MPDLTAAELRQRIQSAAMANRGSFLTVSLSEASQFIAALEDSERLDWWEKHSNYEHQADYETGEIVIYRVTGSVNDRVWDEVAREATFREALDAARKERG